MKTWAPEHLRLAQAAVEVRDTLRSLAQQIDAAAGNLEREAAMLKTARAVAETHADILRAALKDCNARHRSTAAPNAPLWSIGGRA